MIVVNVRGGRERCSNRRVGVSGHRTRVTVACVEVCRECPRTLIWAVQAATVESDSGQRRVASRLGQREPCKTCGDRTVESGVVVPRRGVAPTIRHEPARDEFGCATSRFSKILACEDVGILSQYRPGYPLAGISYEGLVIYLEYHVKNLCVDRKGPNVIQAISAGCKPFTGISCTGALI